MNKIIIAVVIVVAAVAAVMGWWWMSRSETASAPTLPPAARTDADIEELNSIDAGQDLDAEFKAIDQDLNNL
ncbi:MAG: hypothetical protein HYT67_01885 [Candidatus Yanofskybacteria bacterium]|nr:hypothetical protein [Candidatus Yanofskybacteria bacterium]